MSESQKILTEMYQDFVKEIGKTELKWVLYGGNALGAVREGTWIPWDDDLDLAIPAIQNSDFIEFFRKSEVFDIQAPFDKGYPHSFIRLYSKKYTFNKMIGGKIIKAPYSMDVFTIYHEDKPQKRKMDLFWTHFLFARNHLCKSKWINMARKPLKLFPQWLIKFGQRNKFKNETGKYPFENCRFKKPLHGADVFDTIEVDFCGIKSPIFRRYDEYFTSRYDENWRIPHTEDERWTHDVEKYKDVE